MPPCQYIFQEFDLGNSILQKTEAPPGQPPVYNDKIKIDYPKADRYNWLLQKIKTIIPVPYLFLFVSTLDTRQNQVLGVEGTQNERQLMHNESKQPFAQIYNY